MHRMKSSAVCTKRDQHLRGEGAKITYFFDAGLFLRRFCTILGTSLHSARYACSIEGTSDDVISYTREVLNSSASDEYHAVFLEVVADTRNIRSNFHAVCQTDSGNLSKSRVRLLRCYCLNRCAHASLLWRLRVCRNSLKGINTS